MACVLGACLEGHADETEVRNRGTPERFRETCVPGNARVCGSGKASAIWSFRHCKPAACILGLAGAKMQLSLICGSP